MIELGKDSLSIEAAALIADFENTLYSEMRLGHWNTTHIFNEAHEIHDSKLGYGNGRNGKGKTPNGMRDSLNGLYLLANAVPEVSKVQDISIFVKDFAEDCMSDLLTNILHRILSKFTAMQMDLYGVKPTGFHEVRAWDQDTHRWTSSNQPFWSIEGKRILLVPKHWVRKHFLFKTHQYLYTVIIERMRNELGYSGVSKNDIWLNMHRTTEHWEYDHVTEFTSKNPDALAEYHIRMLHSYHRTHGPMSDDALNDVVYNFHKSISA